MNRSARISAKQGYQQCLLFLLFSSKAAFIYAPYIIITENIANEKGPGLEFGASTGTWSSTDDQFHFFFSDY